MTMEIGVVGLGKMGGGIARRLASGGVRVVGYDRVAEVRAELAEDGIDIVDSFAGLVSGIAPPRILWLMLPAGESVERALAELVQLLGSDDIVVDGGNGHYRDAIRHQVELARRGIHFLDVGTSGGIRGESSGYCLMVGGDDGTVDSCAELFRVLAPAADRGWGRVGPAGAGHFVKMVHNGIEYGLLQAYAEGFALLDAKRDLVVEPIAVAKIWQDGSVVRSWLLELIAERLTASGELAEIAPFVEDSGEGRWAVAEALDLDVATPVIVASLLQRVRSRTDDSFADRLIAALRQSFGGHAVRRTTGES